MSKVLVISGSLSKKEASSSYQLLNTFLTKYKIKNPNDEIFFLDLNQEKMASITLSLNNMDTYFNEEDSDKYINQLKDVRSEEHTSELQSRFDLVCRLLLEIKKEKSN